MNTKVRGKVKCEILVENIADINKIVDQLRQGQVLGRVVFELQK